MYQKDCRPNPKRGQTYGNFFGIDHLINYYNIKNTKSIKKLIQLNVNCAHLKNYFKKQELKEIEPLIHLLLSKNNQNELLKAHTEEPSSLLFKKSKTKLNKQTGLNCFCVRMLRPTLNTDLLKKSELSSIDEKDLKRFIMYVEN